MVIKETLKLNVDAEDIDSLTELKIAKYKFGEYECLEIILSEKE